MSEEPKSKRKDSGPLVIHVASPFREQQQKRLDAHNNNSMARRKRRIQPGVIIFFSLVILAAISIFLTNVGALQNETPDSVSTISLKHEKMSTKKGTKKAAKSTHKSFDVNAPPIPQKPVPQKSHSFWENDRTYQKEEKVTPKSSFSFWGQQADRLKEEDTRVSTKKTKKTEKKKKILQPFPVINDEADTIPQGANGATFRAADALMCRAAVIDYVINATDLKDECDGLKKAFTKNCADEEVAPSLATRRRLNDDEQSPTKQQKNPVILWQYRLYRIARSVRRLWTVSPSIMMAEEEVFKEWDSAALEVAQGWDLVSDDDDDALPTSIHRRLVREMSSDDADAPPASLQINKTAATKEKQKLPSLAMPTFKEHVSEKMLMETLMLGKEGNLIASVKAAQNQTNNVTMTVAAADAAASAKAVSDTTELVSSVLNDPSSVEARTCCASILNVFHENCNVDDEDSLSDSRLFIAVAVIAFCGLIKSLIRHFQIRWLPEAAGCILVGGKWPLASDSH